MRLVPKARDVGGGETVISYPRLHTKVVWNNQVLWRGVEVVDDVDTSRQGEVHPGQDGPGLEHGKGEVEPPGPGPKTTRG